MIDSNNLISLFRKYGFDYKKSSSGKGFYAFTFKSGFFHNAEIVYVEGFDEDGLEKSIKELNDIGFSTKKTFFKNFNDVEEILFNGFFNVDEWKFRIKNEYNVYCENMLDILPIGAVKYSYVQVDYDKSKGSVNNQYNGDDKNIVIDILNEIKEDNSKLIIIEAPAGFGKTCTSYEIINKMVQESDLPLPFFTEFSRDRQAKVFSHVFVREVDRSFRTVNSDLVIEETKNGRIVLVLDGFDELLNESMTDVDDGAGFEKTQPMLETIGDLLNKKSKVILTSRRTAIFDGEAFQDWVDDYKYDFETIRYRLNIPKVTDWLDIYRIEKLERNGIDISNLANPVLLSYLRSVNDEMFDDLCKDGSKIVNHYFLSMFERERERQDLLIKPEDQSKILTSIAMDMCDHDYTSDKRERIVDFIRSNFLSLLEETRRLYTVSQRPTIDALSNKLSTHAFFDRSIQGENRVEFVNEFVFGNFISKGLIEYESNDWIAANERFVEPAVQAYLPRNKDERELLWSKLEGMRDFLSSTEHMHYEYLLENKVDSDCYSGSTITRLSFKSICFFESEKIESSVFNECIFSGCTFNLDNFFDVTFISSQFYDCTILDGNSSFDIDFLNCSDNNGFIEKSEVVDEVEDSDDYDLILEQEILKKYIQLGSGSITRLHIYTGVLYKIDGFSRRKITKAIKRLKDKGILENANNSSFTAINKNKIVDVKKIIGV